ncbi:ATPase RavA stimulator ViaA [Lonsdalea quercina]|uniref:ATPase RavA stimulator ViaA n=1 Tax=Lonsdalea quercina TaxID=71657 RepID=UPI003976450C
MLTLESLELLLSIDENHLLDDMLVTLLSTPQLAMFFEKHPRLKSAVMNDLSRWKTLLQQRLHTTAAPEELEKEVEGYQRALATSRHTLPSRLPELMTLLKEVNSPFLAQADKLRHSPDAADHEMSAGLHTLFIQRWRASLTQQTLELHHRIVDQERDTLLEELQQRLTVTESLIPVLAENDTAAGRLWDLSVGKRLTPALQPLLATSAFLQQQPELQQLAERLGRSNATKTVLSQTTPLEPFKVRIREPSLTPEQVSGIHQSDDILRLIPTELSTLGVDELEYEFYRRLAEHRLLTYRLQGEGWREKIQERPVVHQNQEQQPRGPFIVCVDTSGSMGGFNERCAKAFCLALMRIALEDNRRCYIILFSTGVVSYELTSANGLDEAIRFLNQSFRGGTDMADCIAALLDIMASRQWQDADAVMISDFIAQRLPEPLITEVRRRQRQYHHRFHAVAMSDHGKPGILTIFDHIWRFNTGLKSRLQRRLHHTKN